MGSSLRIGLLGLGNMGRVILRKLVAGDLGEYEVILTTDVAENAQASDYAVKLGVPFSTKPADLLGAKLDLVVETASQEAVRTWALQILQSGTSMVVLSVGALADSTFYTQVEDAAIRGSSYLYLPSGAVGALDVLKAASTDDLHSVRLVTRKPPTGLSGHEPITGSEPEVIFRGNAGEAARALPQNLNVAVALALAGVGTDATQVEVIVDPQAKHNSHHIEAVGSFGRLELLLENVPSRDNPRTSQLAVLSALALLRNLHKRVKIGT